ncbi:MAG TPA: hypothetical protein VKA46_43275 [Gemmataceae bacterium]|nr:hypothetical protein [Gemmataceae bacterium]
MLMVVPAVVVLCLLAVLVMHICGEINEMQERRHLFEGLGAVPTCQEEAPSSGRQGQIKGVGSR